MTISAKTQTQRRVWEATAFPDGKFWIIEIPAIDGMTQARSVKEIDVMVRDYISIMTETEPDSFDVNMQLLLPDDVAATLKRAGELRDIADNARKEAAVESRRAAKALRASGLTVRDIGAALGISFQRAHQLVKG
jgi:hypothetical protein